MEVKLLGPGDAGQFDNIAEGVFDHTTDPQLIREFLDDPRHHIAVAIEGGLIIGFASAVHYVHPDKRSELWINEVGVAPSHQRRGAGKAVVSRILEAGRALGCGEAWVLTDRGNTGARALYGSLGGTDLAGDTIQVEFDLGS
jgi:GNAT superfamily N-acetyltransferase